MVALPSMLNGTKCHEDVKAIAPSGDAFFYIQARSNEIMKMNSYEKPGSVCRFECRFERFPEMCHELIDICANKDYLFVSNAFGRIFYIEIKRGRLLTQGLVGYEFLEYRSGPARISLTKKGHILVAGGGKANTLYEYSFDSSIPKKKCPEKRIVMGDGILNPCRAVETINDLILVSQADKNNRICLIDTAGRLLQSFNESPEINFNYPHQLQVDHTGHILVSDYAKGRIILLNPELKYVKDFIPRSDDLGCITTFYLDENRKYLYVADATRKLLRLFNLY